MKILVINGNPKKDGFIAGALEIVASCLEARGVEVQRLRLADKHIQDCLGCFSCLRTGRCVLDDDMKAIIESMVAADGFVVGSPVRNGLTTACYKRFYERITYVLGFPLLLEDKHTLAISCVGLMGGKAANKRLVGLQDVFHTRLSGFIFCAIGLPSRTQPADIRPRLERAADKLVADIQARRPRRLSDRIWFSLDRAVVRRFVLGRQPEMFANVVESWQRKGYFR
jgi:multimeric flavodoxin WrbA